MRARPISRARLVAVVLLALVGLVVAGTPASASPSGQRYGGGEGGTYLALGDSVPFGYRSGQAPPYYADIDNFVGYPEIVAADRHLDLVNASCPGETTASFIDVNAPSVLCNNVGGVRPGYRDVPYPLHVQYADREQSQLQFALTALAAHDVRLITIQLGANDGFLCIADPTNRCDTTAEQLALAEQVRQRLNLILSTLRGAGGYQGQIVVVTYYATNYADPASTAATLILNSGITRAALANRATVASGFLAFAPVAWLRGGGDSQEAGLLYPGDVHPSPAGQCLLARAVEFVAHV